MNDLLNVFAGVKFTFSKHCCSGIIAVLGPDARCECWRCREGRGEVRDEGLAAEVSQQAQVAFRARIREQPASGEGK